MHVRSFERERERELAQGRAHAYIHATHNDLLVHTSNVGASGISTRKRKTVNYLVYISSSQQHQTSPIPSTHQQPRHTHTHTQSPTHHQQRKELKNTYKVTAQPHPKTLPQKTHHPSMHSILSPQSTSINLPPLHRLPNLTVPPSFPLSSSVPPAKQAPSARSPPRTGPNLVERHNPNSA